MTELIYRYISSFFFFNYSLCLQLSHYFLPHRMHFVIFFSLIFIYLSLSKSDDGVVVAWSLCFSYHTIHNDIILCYWCFTYHTIHNDSVPCYWLFQQLVCWWPGVGLSKEVLSVITQQACHCTPSPAKPCRKHHSPSFLCSRVGWGRSWRMETLEKYFTSSQSICVSFCYNVIQMSCYYYCSLKYSIVHVLRQHRGLGALSAGS